MKRSHGVMSTNDAAPRSHATLSDLPAHVLAKVMQGQCAVQAMRLGHVNSALRAKVPYPVQPVEGVPGKSTLFPSDFWTHWTDLRYPRGAATDKDHEATPKWVDEVTDGHVLCVQMAIHRGVDTNVDDFGPLIHAVHHFHLRMAAVLMHDAMAHNPTIHRPQEDDIYVMNLLFSLAMDAGDVALGRHILRTCTELGDVSFAFRTACHCGYTDIVRDCLRGAPGLHVDMDMSHGSALLYACQDGHVDVARMLLGAGADPCLADRGYTPLWAASKNGHVRVVELLLADERVASNRAMIEEAGYHARGMRQMDVDERLEACLRQLDARG